MDFRKVSYKLGLDAKQAFSDRKRMHAMKRQEARARVIAASRQQAQLPSGGDAVFVAEADAGAGPGPGPANVVFAQLLSWKTAFYASTTSLDDVAALCKLVLAAADSVICGRAVLPTEATQLLFLQVLHKTARHLPGCEMLPVFPIFVEGLKSASPDLVRLACQCLLGAMDQDDESCCVHDAMWTHRGDVLGTLLAVFASQRPDIQLVIMLCVKTSLKLRNSERMARLLPFLLTIMQQSEDLQLMALDCFAEMSSDASIEELFALSECGLLKICMVTVAKAATEESLPAVKHALTVIENFASFSDGTDAPSAWLLEHHVLEAFSEFVHSNCIDDDLLRTVAFITANLVVSNVEAVLANTGLCLALVDAVTDDDLEDDTREEALTVFFNMVFVPDLSPTRTQALCDIHVFDAFIGSVVTFGKFKSMLKNSVLQCVSMMLDVCPVHGNDFADCGGIDMLKTVCEEDFGGFLQSMVSKILLVHFPLATL
jgi:hypothetical protein